MGTAVALSSHPIEPEGWAQRLSAADQSLCRGERPQGWVLQPGRLSNPRIAYLT